MSDDFETHDAPSETSRSLRKAVEAIHISGKLTLAQKKFFNHLVLYAFSELENEERHSVSVSKIVRDTEFDSRNMDSLIAVLKAIMACRVDLDLLNTDGNPNKAWSGMQLLAEATVQDGVVHYSFPPTLRKLLNNPKVFAIINLNIQSRFVSAYSSDLYENCVRFKSVGQTRFINLGLWKKLLGAEEKTYDEFKYFNDQILKPSIKEINKVSDITITPEFEKKGRSVSAIKFNIKIKAKGGNQEADILQMDLIKGMASIGVTQKAALEHIKKYPIDYIEENLAIVISRIKSGRVKIENKPAYFAASLERDYRQVKTPLEIEIEEQKLAALKIQKEVAKKEELKQKAESEEKISQLAAARSFFDELSPEAKLALEIEFETHIEKTNMMVFKAYLKTGLFEKKIVTSAFENFIVQNKI